MQNEFISIATTDLDDITGGAQQSSWDAYVKSQRGAVAGDYKTVVCAGAGVKGGPEFAKQVYGADRATSADQVRAATTLKDVCMGGKRLPALAPPSPF